MTQGYTVYDNNGNIVRTGITTLTDLEAKFGPNVLPFMVENPKDKKVVDGKVVNK